mmetsp:Transcript_65169/g.210121  ORF Transcript_65169/g.210121 Transcript_65169/m.210121 type:complete len:212 (+) Transcript_65169:159-794(+)
MSVRTKRAFSNSTEARVQWRGAKPSCRISRYVPRLHSRGARRPPPAPGAYFTAGCAKGSTSTYTNSGSTTASSASRTQQSPSLMSSFSRSTGQRDPWAAGGLPLLCSWRRRQAIARRAALPGCTSFWTTTTSAGASCRQKGSAGRDCRRLLSSPASPGRRSTRSTCQGLAPAAAAQLSIGAHHRGSFGRSSSRQFTGSYRAPGSQRPSAAP